MQTNPVKFRTSSLLLSCLLQSSAVLCGWSAAHAQVTSPFERTLSGTAGTWQFFPLEIPAGTTDLNVTITGGTGDADLYVRPSAQPTETEFACRPWEEGNEETCDTPNPQAGTWYLAINGFDDFSDVTITATWTTPAPAPAPIDPTVTPVPNDPAAPPADPAAAPEGWQKQTLDQHNLYRAKHCAPALTWDEEIAKTAQAWADACVFEHATGTGLGENLSAGTNQTGIEAVDGWYSEIKGYDFASPGFSQDTGHFTQLVWRNSTRLGCGIAKCPGMFTNAEMIVCRYAPQGNITGAYEANVFPVPQDGICQ
jgi:uncharacterized protein YkwD